MISTEAGKSEQIQGVPQDIASSRTFGEPSPETEGSKNISIKW